MKRKLVLITLLFLILKSWTFGFMEEISIKAKGKYIVADSPRINIVIPRNYLTEGELKVFIGKMERSYYRVMKFLDIEEVEEKIYIILVGGRYISNTGGNTIALSYAKENRSPYTHDLVHAMTNIKVKENGIPNWLYERMAIYINELYNEDLSAPNCGEDIHRMAESMIDRKEFQEVLSLHDRYKWTSSGADLRRAFYIFSGSLSRYILKNYGRDYFMDLYINQGMEWLQADEGKKIYGEWISFIIKRKLIRSSAS